MGLPADQAAAAARELLAEPAAMPGLDSAVGLWTKRTLELREPWASGLPVDAQPHPAEEDRNLLEKAAGAT